MPIEDGLLEQLRRAIHQHFAPHRQSALLVAIIAVYGIRPLIGDSPVGSAILGVAMLLLLLLCLYNINVDELVGQRGRLLAQSKRRQILGWALATAAGAGRVAVFFVQSPMLNLAEWICWLLFVLFVTVSLLRSVLKQREVTGETISTAVSIYLLLGLAWAFLYAVLFLMHPESFSGFAAAEPGRPIEFQHFFPILAYFSLTTLSTIGFGDITPLSLQARYAAVAEGITGQFYLAILIARLVGMQMTSRPAARPANRKSRPHSLRRRVVKKSDFRPG